MRRLSSSAPGSSSCSRVVFTLQGVGVLGGSVMSGVTFWAVAGPVIALAGVVLTAIGLRDRPAAQPR